MPRATFDILDASIPDDFTKWQSYPDDVRFESYKRTFLTDPIYWTRHEPAEWAFELEWQEFKYSDVTTDAAMDATIASEIPGIYIFYVRPPRVLHLFPTFAFYIGISNERGSERPLRDRLKDYLLPKVMRKRKRDNIDQMIQMYSGVLWITYALSDKPSADLMALETKLHGFIYPCYSRRDFPDDIKTQQRRFAS